MNTQTKDLFCTNCGEMYGANNRCANCGKLNESALNNIEQSQQNQGYNTYNSQIQNTLANVNVKQKAFNTVSIICISIAAVLTIITGVLYKDLPYLKSEQTDAKNLLIASEKDLATITKESNETKTAIADLNKKIADNQAAITEINNTIAANKLNIVQYKKTIENDKKTIDSLRSFTLITYESNVVYTIPNDTKYFHKIYCDKIAGQQKRVLSLYTGQIEKYTDCPYCLGKEKMRGVI